MEIDTRLCHQLTNTTVLINNETNIQHYSQKERKGDFEFFAFTRRDKRSTDFMRFPLYRILLVDDDVHIRRHIARNLEKAGYYVTEVAHGSSLLQCIGRYLLPGRRHEDIDLIITSNSISGLDIMNLLNRAQSLKHFPPVLLMNASGREKIQLHSKRHYIVGIVRGIHQLTKTNRNLELNFLSKPEIDFAISVSIWRQELERKECH